MRGDLWVNSKLVGIEINLVNFIKYGGLGLGNFNRSELFFVVVVCVLMIDFVIFFIMYKYFYICNCLLYVGCFFFKFC